MQRIFIPQARWDILYKMQQNFAKRNHPVRDWHPIFLRKVLHSLESAVINVGRRRGWREGRKTPPRVHQDDSSSSCGTCIRARLTLARHKFMQNNSTTTVHYGVDGAGSKTLPEPRVCFDRPRREYALLLLLRAAPFVFWLAISIRLTLRGDPARFIAERLN